MWEDTENRRGGRWLVPLHRQARPGSNGGLHGRAHVDNFWLEIMLCLIGEAFGPEHGKVVNGAVISLRGKQGSRRRNWNKFVI
jgi:translation initiation factor 4E